MAATCTIKTMALIDCDLYDKFRSLRKQMISDGIGDLAKVFVPVGAAAPARLNRTAPRVLFVGKATNGWNEGRLDSFDGSKKLAEDILKDFCGLTNRSAFWQFSRAVLRQALRSCNIEADNVELASFSGWSNLVLIGNTGSYSPPIGRALDRQKELCIEALRSEIVRFRPTAVVLVSQLYAMHEIAHPVFAGDDGTWSFDSPQEDVAYKFHPDLETTVVWANHPQGMRPLGTRARVQTLVADLVARATQGQPLPRSA